MKAVLIARRDFAIGVLQTASFLAAMKAVLIARRDWKAPLAIVSENSPPQ